MAEFSRKAAERIIQDCHVVEAQFINGPAKGRRYPIGGDEESDGWIEFTPTQTWSTSDADFSATVTAVHGYVPDAVDAAVTIKNTKLAFSGTASSLGVCAIYDPATKEYYCVFLVNSLTVVTDLQVTGVTLQKKTRSIRIAGSGDESDWTTFHTGETCDE